MDKNTEKQGRGGRREGSGRPVEHPEGATVFVGFTVPAELRARLDQWAESHGVSRSAAVTEAIRRLMG